MNLITYPCGCVNAIDLPSGVLRSSLKCEGHRAAMREVGDLGAEYYAELGVIVDGRPQLGPHLDQLTEALGEITPVESGRVLEIGCGVSMYAHRFLERGYTYVGVEPSRWAAEFTARWFGVEVQNVAIEDANLLPGSFDLILAAHSLEHLRNAPAGIRKCADLLKTGGELWIIVPDDEDPLNPDHLWFFTEATLRDCAHRAGLVAMQFAVRRHVKHESFLYIRARKRY